MAKVFIYQGYAYGSFEPKPGESRDYFNLYVTSAIPPLDMPNYHAEGFKAEKFPVQDKDVLRIGKLKPGSLVELYFDERKKVCAIVDHKE